MSEFRISVALWFELWSQEKNDPNNGSCVHCTPNISLNLLYGPWSINVGFSEDLPVIP
jgi:hypothetical protein